MYAQLFCMQYVFALHVYLNTYANVFLAIYQYL